MKNTRNKIIIAVLAMITALSLSGCTEADKGNGFNDVSVTITSPTITEAPVTTEAPVETEAEVVVTTTEKAEVTTEKTTTTAKKVTTTKKTTTTQKKPEEVKINTNLSKLRTHDYFDVSENEIYNKTFKIGDNTTGNLFKNKYSFARWIFFNFSDHGIAGSGLNNIALSEDYVNNINAVTYTEAYFGIKAEIKDNRMLNVESYSHLNNAKLTDIKIQADYDVNVKPNYTVDISKGKLTADLYDDFFSNGLYAITATYKYGNETCHVNLYLFVNCKSDNASDYHFYICYGQSSRDKDKYTPAKRREQITAMINKAGITPEKSLNANIAYPYEAGSVANYDTQYWKDFSYDIIKGYENESDAFKATLLHDWMTSHLAYDDYKVNYLAGPRYKNDYASKKYYMSRINVGVCRDFSNVYTIMCREQGIPCIMLDTDTHVWNAIYIDGEWIELDLTYDVSRHAYSKDYTDITGSTLYSYYTYCNYYSAGEPTGVNSYLHLYG